MRFQTHATFAQAYIRFQRCLGEGSRFGAINKQIDCSNEGRVRHLDRYSKRQAGSTGLPYESPCEQG
jgi:hypothetical protein